MEGKLSGYEDKPIRSTNLKRPNLSLLPNFVQTLVYLLFPTVAVLLILSGQQYWRDFSTDVNKCESSTSDWESYYKIELSPADEAQFPLYKLYVVGELYTEDKYKDKNFSFTHDESLEGIPVLFLPGNAGFHEQGRTISSILTHMIENRGYKDKLLFDYFTIDFNEEKLALSGHYLVRTRAYAEACVKRIAAMYGSEKKILLIGHSIGGVIARSLDSFGVEADTLISIASPQLLPVVYLDHIVEDFYTEHLKMSSQDRFVISFTPGRRDFTVPGYLTRLPDDSNEEYYKHMSFESIPKVHQSAGHIESSFCRSTSMIIARMIFDWADMDKMSFVNFKEKMKAFRFHFIRNPGPKSLTIAASQPINASFSTNCIPVNSNSRTFFYLSEAKDSNYLYGRTNKGKVSRLGNKVFSSLPPFNVKGQNKFKEYYLPSYKYAKIDIEWLRNFKITELCVPLKPTGVNDEFSLTYAFNADSYHKNVPISSLEYVTVPKYAMYGEMNLIGLRETFHVLSVETISTCDVAFLVFHSEDATTPFELGRGASHLSEVVVTWLSYEKTSVEIVKPIGCEVKVRFSQSSLGFIHYVRSHIPSLPTYFSTLLLLVINENIENSFEKFIMQYCFSVKFLLKLFVLCLVISKLPNLLLLQIPLFSLDTFFSDLKYAFSHKIFHCSDPFHLFLVTWVEAAVILICSPIVIFLLKIFLFNQDIRNILIAVFSFPGCLVQAIVVFCVLVLNPPPSFSCLVVVIFFILLNINNSVSDVVEFLDSMSSFKVFKSHWTNYFYVLNESCEKTVNGPTKLSLSNAYPNLTTMRRRFDQLGLIFCCFNSVPCLLFLIALILDSKGHFTYVQFDPTFANALCCCIIYLLHLVVKFVFDCFSQLSYCEKECGLERESALFINISSLFSLSIRKCAAMFCHRFVPFIFYSSLVSVFATYLFRVYKALIFSTVLYVLLVLRFLLQTIVRPNVSDLMLDDHHCALII